MLCINKLSSLKGLVRSDCNLILMERFFYGWWRYRNSIQFISLLLFMKVSSITHIWSTVLCSYNLIPIMFLLISISVYLSEILSKILADYFKLMAHKSLLVKHVFRTNTFNIGPSTDTNILIFCTSPSLLGAL